VNGRPRDVALAADQDDRRLAASVQTALLPASLPVLPRVCLAARYSGAGQDQAAGGDWFDAVPLGNGTVALIVGDIVGHGVAASAAMAQLRAVTNERLLAETDLSLVLAQLNAFAFRTISLRAATLAIVVLDPVAGLLTYATCGHPPPLIVSPAGGTRFLPPSGSGPLGTGSAEKLATATIEPDGMVFLYSDGLIERPGRSLADGKRELAAVAAQLVQRPPPDGSTDNLATRLCQVTADTLAGTSHADDVTVLAAQLLAAPVGALEAVVPAQTSGLAAVRDALDNWLDQLDPHAENRADLRLAVTEIVTNAIEHAYSPGEAGSVEFRAVLHDDGNLYCEIKDHGHWRRPDPAIPYRGNGLMVAGHVMEHMEIKGSLSRTEGGEDAPGTTVILRHGLVRPAVLAVNGSDEPSASQAAVGFNVAIEHRDGVPEATVSGPVDILTAERLDNTLMAACRGGSLPLRVNLSKVSYLASTGVRALYSIRQRLADQHRALTLIAAPASPAALVLKLVGLGFTAEAEGEPRRDNRGGIAATG
jgi:anti-anti-sigma factor